MMFGRRYCVCDFHEMKHTTIATLLIAFIIASANIRNYCVVATEQQQAEQLEPIQKYAVIGKNFTISCDATTNVPFKWRKDATNITESNKRFKLTTENIDEEFMRSNLTIHKVEANDTGNYTCEHFGPFDGDSVAVKKQFTVTTVILPRIAAQSSARIEAKISQSVLLFCVIEAYPLEDFKKNIRWVKEDVSNGNSIHKNPTQTSHSSKDDQAFISNRTKIYELDKQ